LADAWGGSWGTSWGSSWDRVAAVATGRDRSDAGFRRGPKRVFILPRPEPVAAPLRGKKLKRRRVTQEAIEAAVAQPWAGLWSVPEAIEALPRYVPIRFQTMDPQGFDTLVQAVALWLADEAARREEDEEDVLLLLAA
jgi:hypothetical protein